MGVGVLNRAPCYSRKTINQKPPLFFKCFSSKLPIQQLPKPKSVGEGLDTTELRNNLRDLKDFADEEMKIVENYLEKFDNLSKKVSQIQTVNINAIKRMKETMNKLMLRK